jgi:MFS family permease
MVGLIIWPIFIWQLLDGNYFEVGVISSLIVIVTVALQIVVGKYIDKGNKQKMLKYGSGLYALGWVFKIFIATAFQIFIASTYHSLVKVFARTSFDTLNYEMAADQGHYVDEYTVLREMAISFGRMLMSLLIIFLISKFNLEWSFILAALAALTMNFLAGVGDAHEENRIKEKLKIEIK